MAFASATIRSDVLYNSRRMFDEMSRVISGSASNDAMRSGSCVRNFDFT